MTQITTSSQRKVGIVGGGIGGLTAALALLKRGIDVEVYEQSNLLKEVGAGVQIGSNGTRVLYALGLEDALSRVQSVQTGPASCMRSDSRTRCPASRYCRRGGKSATGAPARLGTGSSLAQRRPSGSARRISCSIAATCSASWPRPYKD